jgi:NTP pyrophosphatase (non-canonical NTP hydrolase)
MTPEPPKTKTMKTPYQVIKQIEDANELQFNQADLDWIVIAMEEYASLKCDHPGGLVVTSETGQTIHKCLDCGNERPVHDYTDKLSILPLSSLIEQWAEEKGILSKATPIKQAMKTQEEVNELLSAILDDNRDEIKDAIGDIMVTLIIQCKMQSMDLEDCLESAYNVIKNRTGKMVDGVFVKD